MKHQKQVYLVCLDGSDGSKECLVCLGRVLQDNDEVNLITVANKHDEESKAKAGNILVNGQENIHKVFPDVKVEHYIVFEKDAREAILEQARNLSVDFILIGNRGLTGLKKLQLGSVSEYVCRHSEVPVIVARPKE